MNETQSEQLAKCHVTRVRLGGSRASGGAALGLSGGSIRRGRSPSRIALTVPEGKGGTDMEDDLEQRALAFARRAHESIDHRRKYTDEPYIVHPIAVAELVKSVPHTPEMVAAAYLHDVVEDTPVTIVRPSGGSTGPRSRRRFRSCATATRPCGSARRCNARWRYELRRRLVPLARATVMALRARSLQP